MSEATPRWDDAQGKYIWESADSSAAEVPDSGSLILPPQEREPEVPSDPHTLTFKDVYPAYGYSRDKAEVEADPIVGFDDAGSEAILAALPAEVPAYIKAVLLLMMGAHRGANRG